MTSTALKSQAFKLKGRLYTFTVLQVIHPECEAFSRQLTDVFAKAPKLFDKAPVVLDFSYVKSPGVDLGKLCDILRHLGIIPVAIQGGNSVLETFAQSQGMAILKSSSNQDRSFDSLSQDTNAPPPVKTKLLTAPVRSGQQIVATNSDLVVAASVSHGAELLADGNIHVYGPLRGRALAGIGGNINVRIFCQSLEAELVSIAGYYRLSDAMTQPNGPCQIYLKDEQIQIDPL